jgi:hypothetical protein
MSDYITDDGFAITDEMVDRWAADAEAGFPDSTVTPVDGRPWKSAISLMTTKES